MGGAPTANNNDDDLDELDIVGGPGPGMDPLTAINQKKA